MSGNASNNKLRVPSKSRYHGNITIEMIDDFFTPISKRKEVVSTVKFAPVSTTEGQGLIEPDPRIGKRINLSYGQKELLKAQGESTRDFDYVQKNKRCYEKELKENSSRLAELQIESFLNETAMTEDRSVVGSAMSQIESVSTMNMDPARKAELMKRVCKLNRIGYDEEASMLGDENNNMSKLEKLLTSAEQIKDEDEDLMRRELVNELCDNYSFKSSFEINLPITEKMQKLKTFIASYPFCIIQGNTGCGKTTQVPQFILDSHVKERKYCNIIVTQPRRIAAISVSKRVCAERNWRLGGLCGYQIGLDRENISEDTRITYCTTGILLQKLIGPNAEENFNKYTHIILDEVHERDLETDFVLLIIKLKSLQKLTSKVILMSATIDVDKFRKYYATQGLGTSERCYRLVPVMTIDAAPFNVQEFYWEDLVDSKSFMAPMLTSQYKQSVEKFGATTSVDSYGYGYKFNSRSAKINQRQIEMVKPPAKTVAEYKQNLKNVFFNIENPEMHDEPMQMVISLLRYFDELEIQQIRAQNGDDTCETQTDLDTTIDSNMTEQSKKTQNKPRIIDGLAENRDSVLIFVPGMQQINNLTDLINKELPGRKLNVLPLHSDIVIEQQVRVFEKSEPTWRKVIISTSIAESSITVSDIKYVIDFGLTKELFCDPFTGYTHLRLEWASQSSMNQRRGRAGRVSNGTCYRLISKRFFDELDAYTKPAILREPLSSVILNVKRLKQQGEPKKILSLAIQPPKLGDIQRTVLLLKEVGALTLSSGKSSDGTYLPNNPYDGELTYVGKIMANLPIDPRLSKLILLGHAFGKLREALVIAAGHSTKTIFTRYIRSDIESFKAKWAWSEGWMCDSICILNVYNLWENMNENGTFNSRSDRLKWAKKNMIQLDRLREVENLKNELESRLKEFKIVCSRKVVVNRNRKTHASGSKNDEPLPYQIDDHDDSVRQNLIIKMIIAGAFYPNYFTAEPIDIDQAEKYVSLKDIKNTVMVKNLPNNEGIFYQQKLQDIFRICSNSAQMHFDSTKVFIEFKTQYEQMSTNVNIAVYLAVQMRLLRTSLRLQKFTQKAINEKSAKLDLYRKSVAGKTVTIGKNRSGVVKFSYLNNKLSELEETLTSDHDDSFNEQSGDEDADNVHLNFITNTRKKMNDDFDTSQYLSCATILSKQEMGEKTVNVRGGSYSTLDTSIISRASSIISSSSLIVPSLSSNRLTPGQNQIAEFLSNPKYLIPEKADNGEAIEIYISDIIECGLFWAQIQDSAHVETLAAIQDTLNTVPSNHTKTLSHVNYCSSESSSTGAYILKLLNPIIICLDTLCVTRYTDECTNETQLYRAKVINVDKESQTCEVLFIDYGNREKKLFKELFEMSYQLQQYPFQAMQCQLANIKVSLFKNPNGTWTKASTLKFKSIINKELNKKNSMKLSILGINDANVVLCKLTTHSSGLAQDIGLELVKSEFAEEVVDRESEKSRLHSSKNACLGNRYYIPSKSDGYTRTKPNIANASDVRLQLDYKKALKSGHLLNSTLDTSILSETTHSLNDETMSNISSSIADFTSHLDFLDNVKDDENSYDGWFELNGPYSPLEVTYHSLMMVGRNKLAKTERESINCVTLDDDPYNRCTRMMVAAEVTLNNTGNGMILRKNTLMPKLPGLASICCLLFTPQAEFRTDEKRTRYTGALCGLGYDSQGAIYTDNDVETVFDVEIDVQDITMINALRLAINMVIGSEKDVSGWNDNEVNLKQLQQKACTKLLQVIQRNRKLVEPVYYDRPYWWDTVDHDDIVYIMQIEDDPLKPKYYSYHNCVNLEKQRFE